MEWYLKCLRQYADFEGRARRKEYWMFTLFNAIFAFVFSFITALIGLPFLAYIYSLFVFVPGIAVTARRLHDIGKSGWMQLIVLIPIIGWIWLLILLVQDGQSEANEYGSNPKGY